MASVAEPDFAWMTRGVQNDATSDEYQPEDNSFASADYESTIDEPFGDTVDETVDQQSGGFLDGLDLALAECLTDDVAAHSFTATRAIETEVASRDPIDRPIVESAPAVARAATRKTLLGHFAYFGSSALAALVAVVPILWLLGVNVFQMTGPLGYQPAIALFVEVILCSSFTIATCAYLCDHRNR